VTDLNELKTRLLADGKIDDEEVGLIRRHLYADGKIDREEVEFLIALREQAAQTCPAFEELFFEALKQNVLSDGSIDADEAAWLRAMLFADGKIDESEKKFLTALHAEARQVSSEFQKLFDECVKQ
jgi:uncharacterized membrane protein YebE (DUF533 family)